MVHVSTFPSRFWRLCRLKFVAANDRGSLLLNIWLCCGENVDVNIISSTTQKIIVEASFDSRKYRISGVYASTKYVVEEDSGLILFKSMLLP